MFAGDGVSGRTAGVPTRRGASGRRVTSKRGAGVAASVVCWIGTVRTGSMEDPGATWQGEALRDGRGFRAVVAHRATAGGVGPDWAKP